MKGVFAELKNLCFVQFWTSNTHEAEKGSLGELYFTIVLSIYMK